MTDEFLYKLIIQKITDNSGNDINDKNMKIKVSIDSKEFELKQTKDMQYEGQQIFKRKDTDLTGTIKISGLENYSPKEIPLTISKESTSTLELLNQIPLIKLTPTSTIFQFSIKGLLLEENSIPLPNAQLKIEIIQKNSKKSNNIINSKECTTNDQGKYSNDIQIKEKLQEDISVKICTKDNWVQEKCIEKSIKLDLEKQQSNQVQDIEIDDMQVILLKSKAFTFEGTITADEQNINNAKILIELKDTLTGKSNSYNSKSDKGNYEIEIKDEIRMGVQYQVQFTVDVTNFEQYKETINIKVLKEKDSKTKDIQLKTNLQKKTIEIKGEIIKIKNKEADIIVQIKKDSKWEDLLKGSSSQTGEFKLTDEITTKKNEILPAKLIIKSDNIQTYEKEFTIDMKETTIDLGNIEVKQKQLELTVSGQTKDNQNKESLNNVELVIKLMEFNSNDIIESKEEKSNDKGKFSVLFNKNLEIKNEYQVVITASKPNYQQTSESKFSTKMLTTKEKLENLEILLEQVQNEIKVQVKGTVLGVEADEILQDATVILSASYDDKNNKKQDFILKEVTNEQGEFDLTKKLQLSSSTVISCKLTIEHELYKDKIEEFELTNKNNFKKTLKEIQLNFNFPEPKGYETISGQITRGEKCNDLIVSNPVPNIKFQFFLDNYYSKKLFYQDLQSDSNGEFILQAPVYDFDYNGLLYFPYKKIEGSNNAYVSSQNTFLVKKTNSGDTLRIGSIQMANRIDEPYECTEGQSSQHQNQQSQLQ